MSNLFRQTEQTLPPSYPVVASSPIAVVTAGVAVTQVATTQDTMQTSSGHPQSSVAFTSITTSDKQVRQPNHARLRIISNKKDCIQNSRSTNHSVVVHWTFTIALKNQGTLRRTGKSAIMSRFMSSPHQLRKLSHDGKNVDRPRAHSTFCDQKRRCYKTY